MRLKILSIGFLVLLLNSAYLAAYADPTIFYMGNVLLHLGLGILLTIFFAVYLVRNPLPISGLFRLGTLTILIGAASGLLLIWTGATRAYHWLLYFHIAASTVGSILMVIYLYIRSRKEVLSRQFQTTTRLFFATLAIAILFPIAIRSSNYRSQSSDVITNPTSPPLSMYEEGGGKESPFFPSSAETTSGKTIPSTFFMTSDTCKRCHEEIYNQWFSSAHHFSSFNNQWYRKSVEYMQDVVGTKPSKWCGGCHDHAVLFNGMMDTPIKEIIQTPEAQAGLACTSCHAIVQVKSSMGQGDFLIEYPALHDLAVSKNKWLQRLHDFLVYTDPEPHKKVFMKPFVRASTPEFCSSCHKVHLDVPVNSYRWSRGFNDYDNWQASGVSGQGARAFYYPPKPKKCADCHMPLVDSTDPAAVDGKVNSHRFPGANTALPYVNRDPVQLKVVEDFLKANQVTVDIFAVSREEAPEGGAVKNRGPKEAPELRTMFAIGEESSNFGAVPTVIRKPAEVTAPIDKVGAVVRRGETVRLDVVVRTRGVGHFFPGGTVDAFDVWLELQAVDDRGKIIFWSGKVEDGGKGPVEKGAHFYRSLLLDERGNRINKRNAWAARSVAYVRLIPPGAADTAHFRITIPEDCGDTIRLKAKLNYRKFAWWNTNWAFAGVRDPEQSEFELAPGYDEGRWVFKGDTSKVSGKIKAIPDLPIVTMHENEITLKVTGSDSPVPAAQKRNDPADRERWNDYGIGLLLQGDLKGAEQAFIRVTELEPKYVDGWVNIGRARLQEGDISGTADVLKKALSFDPELAKANFFYAMALKAQGQYDPALQHLRKAASKYPRDRVVVNQIGRILFLERRYNDAIVELHKVLLIDPEDLQAHYNLMLCYQGIGDAALAEKERKLYMRFKADEASQTITGNFRRLNPEDNNERQSIHEHESAKLDSAVSYK